MEVTAVVGTVKGAFLLRSSDHRTHWEIEGPMFKGWKVTAAARTPDGHDFVATASDVYGPAIHRGQNLSGWEQLENGPRYPEEGGRQLKQIWAIEGAHGFLYVGVDEAGLFRSRDGGVSWEPLGGLNDHETREAWMPGFGGLCAHSLLFDSQNPQRIWCGISAVGVFRSDDGGVTWQPKNQGVPVILEDAKHKEIGFCVHGLAQDPRDPNRIYRQDHRGMYRSTNGGDSWAKNDDGLPSRFGFPITIDKNSGTLFAFPLESDEYRLPVDGKFCVYRSRNGGDSWEALTEGLPQEHAYMGVLRGAMDTDGLDPVGVYVGSSSGTLHVSNDSGDRWQTLPCTLPRILCVRVFTSGS